MSTIPTIDHGCTLFPVAGDTFRILPGLTVTVAGHSTIDIVSPTAGTIGIVTGRNVTLSGGTDCTFAVTAVDYRASRD